MEAAPDEVRIGETHIPMPVFEAILQPQTIASCHSSFESLPEATDDEIVSLLQPTGQSVAIQMESIDEERKNDSQISSDLCALAFVLVIVVVLIGGSLAVHLGSYSVTEVITWFLGLTAILLFVGAAVYVVTEASCN